jgi:branched-chain amino acid transport system ATP-binding protein
MTTLALQATGLRKRFNALVATDGVSIDVAAGARLALIGPNGAGKTTLIGLLTGSLVPDEGRVLLEGQDVTALPAARRVKHGLIRTFQINNLFRRLTVLENIYLACSEHQGQSLNLFRPAGRCKETLDRVEQVLQTLGIAELRHQTVADVSYGRQRLIELAIALSLEPKVLLLDEPAAGIPSGELSRLLEVIERLPREIAILMIEHDMQVVRRFANQVIVLVAGSVLMTGTPQEVMASEQVKSAYLGRGGGAPHA